MWVRVEARADCVYVPRHHKNLVPSKPASTRFIPKAIRQGKSRKTGMSFSLRPVRIDISYRKFSFSLENTRKINCWFDYLCGQKARRLFIASSRPGLAPFQSTVRPILSPPHDLHIGCKCAVMGALSSYCAVEASFKLFCATARLFFLTVLTRGERFCSPTIRTALFLPFSK